MPEMLHGHVGEWWDYVVRETRVCRGGGVCDALWLLIEQVAGVSASKKSLGCRKVLRSHRYMNAVHLKRVSAMPPPIRLLIPTTENKVRRALGLHPQSQDHSPSRKSRLLVSWKLREGESVLKKRV